MQLDKIHTSSRGTHINSKVSEYEAIFLERCSRLSYQKVSLLATPGGTRRKFQTIIWKDNTLTAGILLRLRHKKMSRSTRIRQQSRCTTFRRSEAEGQEQRGRSGAARGCRPGRKQQVSGSRPREVRQQTVRRGGSEGRKLVSW